MSLFGLMLTISSLFICFPRVGPVGKLHLAVACSKSRTVVFFPLLFGLLYALLKNSVGV